MLACRLNPALAAQLPNVRRIVPEFICGASDSFGKAAKPSTELEPCIVDASFGGLAV